jgi:hypothetical protein
MAEAVTNPRLQRFKVMYEMLKMSAALSGSYSLSANQIGFPMSVFTIHKDIPYDQWLCKEAME